MRKTTGTAMAMALLLAGGCGDTDAGERAGEPAEEQQEDRDLVDGEARGIQNARWFREGGVLEFNERSWIISGESVWDPAVEPVGEYEGTTIHAEVGVTPPYTRLFVPLGDDYWQMLEPTSPPDVTGSEIEGLPQSVPGVEPRGNPTGSGVPDEGGTGPGG